MSNNLVIFPEKDFLNSESNNLFIDQFCFDSFKDKSFKNFVINNSTNLKSERMQSYELVNKIFYKILNILKTWTAPKLPINGDDVIKYKKINGKEIGMVLNKIERWWVKNYFLPTRKECLKKLKSI